MNTGNIMNLHKLFKISISCILLHVLFAMPVAFAETYQSHGSIYWAAKNYVRKHVLVDQVAEVKAGKLDSRLKLKKCNKYLQVYMPKGSREIGKTTVGVKCTGSNPWSLHVPVIISINKKVLVTRRQLNKGEVLTAADIKLEKHDLAKLSYGYYEDINNGIGMKLKRRVLAGTVLTPAMLKKPQVVRRGQNVTLLAQSGRMSVRMSGKALDNGAVGERIKVMNIKSGKKLEGTITSSGEIEVDI